MSSKLAPRSSAMIWASVVSNPWPWEATPKAAVMAPVESMEIFAVSEPVLIGIPGATAMRDPIPVSSA
jgi:hypothetical protein